MSKFLHEKETKWIITFAGNPFTLLGESIEIGTIAPDATLIDSNLKPVKISDFKGKNVILSIFPSIDTGICSLQTKTFSKLVTGLSNDIVLLNISRDLPFALKRFCAAEGLENALTLSDYREGEFGLKYGLLIKELMLLSRAVLILDKEGKLIYKQIVKEVASEPNYQEALNILR